MKSTMTDRPQLPDGRVLDGPSLPLVIATILPVDGTTGVDTHILQLRRYLEERRGQHIGHPVLLGPPPYLPSFWYPPARTGAIQPCQALPGICTGTRCSFTERCARASAKSATASSTRRIRSPPGLRCAPGRARTSAWSWRFTSGSRWPMNGPTRSRSGQAGPCSGPSGRWNERSSPRSTALCSCPGGRGMRC